MSTATTGVRTGIRLPKSAHTDQPWRIHDIAPDFVLEDVWALPTPGGPDDFHHLVDMCAAADAYDNPAPMVNLLMSIRWKIGALLGWDKEEDGIARVTSLRERLPADLRTGPTGPQTPNAPFHPVYQTENELVGEYVAKTVHSIGHYSWVRTPDGGYRGQMAVLIKPNGTFGRLYMAGIKPFRYGLVYPSLMRWIAKDWRRRLAEEASPPV